MISFFMVFAGGGLGSVCRYAVGLLAKMLFGGTFPLGTLFVNLLGCFAIGYLSSRFERMFATQEIRNLCSVGFLGGFTTFSAFGVETMNLFRSGSNGTAILNITLNVALGILLAFAGFYLGKK
ncbi:MAG: fluoride efflux transporter CrcB [Fibromonadaceae bacterium]|nr:fluoride efflux transporter CrcB [Fibromonadaceae bacterium]